MKKITQKRKQDRSGSKPHYKKTANREYKSTIFCMLFREKEKLLSLYNAVNHSSYENAEDLEIVTLDNAIFLNMKNDLAFVIDTRLHLYEHQSTYNPNMPLRDLFYVSDEYQRLVVNRSLYSSTPIRIPAPQFLVFYNGLEQRPEKETFLLSDLYLSKETDPQLELKVTVLNINPGNNTDLLLGCRDLNEYMQYIKCIRSYLSQNYSLEDAVLLAVDECIRNGILSDFLLKNKAEAIKMSIYEYNEAEEKRKMRNDIEIYKKEMNDIWKQEAIQQGLAEGRAKGHEEGLARGREEGLARGHEEGLARGREEGLQQAREEIQQQFLLSLIQKKLQKGFSIERIAEDLEVDALLVKKVQQEL